MLPEPHRLHRTADFSATVRRGRRTGRRDIVVHARSRNDEPSLVSPAGARFGLVVSKSVGSAVVRHRVARRLRHVCATVLPLVAPDTDVVLRALPGAATASSPDLERQIRSGLTKLGVTMRSDPTTVGRP